MSHILVLNSLLRDPIRLLVMELLNVKPSGSCGLCVSQFSDPMDCNNLGLADVGVVKPEENGFKSMATYITSP